MSGVKVRMKHSSLTEVKIVHHVQLTGLPEAEDGIIVSVVLATRTSMM